MKIVRATVVALAAAALSFSPTAVTAASTGGSGGPLTDRLDVPFSSGGLTSDHHVFAKGLDWSKTVGLLVYGDGSGGYGLDNPNASYLLDADGQAGLVAVAKKHNLLLVVPEAPGPGCNGYDNCWFDSTAAQKAAWSNALVNRIKSQYDIDEDRVVIGGYSSGAQWANRWFLPTYGEAQSVDLSIAIAYGGSPAATARFTPAYKAATTVSFDTGTADQAYTSSAAGALGGHAWYTAAGFKTDATWPAGVGHARSGQFAAIVDREVTQHLRPTRARTSTPTPTPTTSVAYATTVTSTSAGVTFKVQVPQNAAAPTYVRLTGPRSTYLYTSTKPLAELTFTTLGTDGAKWNYAVYAGSSTSSTPRASGSFSTVVR